MRRRAAVATSFAALLIVTSARADANGSLRSRLGVRAAETLEASDSLDDRLQGLERLRATGTPRAVARLVDALDPGGKAVTPEERLTIVRALAEHTDDGSVRRALVRVLGGHAAASAANAPEALDDLARDTAALALGRAGTPDALSALGKALEGPDRGAAAARAGLVAYPPRELATVLGSARVPTLALVITLETLADQRAFAALREIVRTGAPEVRARAALALTRLGDYETVELARKWRGGDQPVAYRLAAARILAMSHAAEATLAVTALLRDPETSRAGIELALDAPAPSWVPELARLLETAEPDRVPSVVGAIGRAGGRDAAKVLEAALLQPSLASLAAYALASMSGDDAKHALERALAAPRTARLAARAGAVRHFLTGDSILGLERVLTRLSRSTDSADRAVGAAGLAVLHPDLIDGFIASRDEAVVRSVASCLLLANDRVAAKAVERLSEPLTAASRDALALGLAVPGAEEHAPDAVLVALADAGGAAAPLAARALAARDDPERQSETDALLAADDPWIRIHAALGLGRSRRPDATGRLEAAYRFETVPEVREAMVRALSVRSEPTRTRTLDVAATLDPDVTVRTLATRAKAGASFPDDPRGNAVSWLPIASNKAGGPPGVATMAVQVAGGLVLPVSMGPGGLAVAVGLPAGPVTLRVAPAHEADNAPGKGANEK